MITGWINQIFVWYCDKWVHAFVCWRVTIQQTESEFAGLWILIDLGASLNGENLFPEGSWFFSWRLAHYEMVWLAYWYKLEHHQSMQHDVLVQHPPCIFTTFRIPVSAALSCL